MVVTSDGYVELPPKELSYKGKTNTYAAYS